MSAARATAARRLERLERCLPWKAEGRRFDPAPTTTTHRLIPTGNTLAGDAGASLRELMDRMGHSTTCAALIYQHRTSLRDKMIADEISRRADAERPQSGTQRARDDEESP